MKLFIIQKSIFFLNLFNLVFVQQRNKRRKWIFMPVSPMKRLLCFPWRWLRLIAKSLVRDSSCRLQSPIWTKSENEDVMGENPPRRTRMTKEGRRWLGMNFFKPGSVLGWRWKEKERVERQRKEVTAPQHLFIHALTHVGTHAQRFSTLCVL